MLFDGSTEVCTDVSTIENERVELPLAFTVQATFDSFVNPDLNGFSQDTVTFVIHDNDGMVCSQCMLGPESKYM